MGNERSMNLLDLPTIQPFWGLESAGNENGSMAKKVEQKSYDGAVAWLRDHGFDLLEAPGASNRVFLKKYNVSAAIEKQADGTIKIFAYPGYLVGGEIQQKRVCRNGGPPQSHAQVLRRIEGSDWRNQPLQRIAGDRKRSLRV